MTKKIICQKKCKKWEKNDKKKHERQQQKTLKFKGNLKYSRMWKKNLLIFSF